MTRTKSEEELAQLRPPMLPRPVPPLESPLYQAWRRAFQEYADRKQRLEVAALIEQLPTSDTMEAPGIRGYRAKKNQKKDAGSSDQTNTA